MVKKKVDSLLKRIFKESFAILTEFSRALSEANKTMSSEYKRALKSGETRDKHMGDL